MKNLHHPEPAHALRPTAIRVYARACVCRHRRALTDRLNSDVCPLSVD